MSYVRLGKEADRDLRATCVPCHATEHPEKIRLDPFRLLEKSCRVCGVPGVTVIAVRRLCCYECPSCGESWTEERKDRRTRRVRKSKGGKALCKHKKDDDAKRKATKDHAKRRHEQRSIEAAIRKASRGKKYG